MMGSLLRLERFQTDATDLPEDDGRFYTASELELERSAAYAKGLVDGAVSGRQEHEREALDVQRRLADALEALSFTYHQGYAQALKGLKPYLEAVLGSFLPSVARETLAAMVAEHLVDLARELGAQSLTVLMRSEDVARLRTAVRVDLLQGLEVRADDELGDLSVRIVTPSDDLTVDFSPILQRVRDGLQSLFPQELKEMTHV